MTNLERLIAGMMFPVGLAFGVFVTWGLWELMNINCWTFFGIPIGLFLITLALAIWGIK